VLVVTANLEADAIWMKRNLFILSMILEFGIGPTYLFNLSMILEFGIGPTYLFILSMILELVLVLLICLSFP